MRFGRTLGILVGFGMALGPPTGCSSGDCTETKCDYTHITLFFVDAADDPGDATRVTYTVAPYDADGVLMTDSDMADAGIDPTEVHKATCAARDPDTGTCPTWVLLPGFGVVAITASLDDTDGIVAATATLNVDLTVPAKSKNQSCCGLVHADEETVTLDPTASTDTAADTASDTSGSP